jgi:hypothetical protein
MTDWRDLFCGRAAELEALRDAYDAVAGGAGPRAAVILGDRGMGKTRLVREFYSFLTRERDPEDYWPAASLFHGKNVLVGPDIERDPAVREHFAGFALASRRMPFLWWGVRLADPEERNAPITDLATHRRFLDVHLEPLRQIRRLAENREAMVELGRDVARSGAMKAVEWIPVIGQAVSFAIDTALFGRRRDTILEERRRMLERHEAEQVTRIARIRADDLLGATLADLEALFSAAADPPAGGGTAADAGVLTPLVLFVDDAQFARPGGDEGVLELVAELWTRALMHGWPVLLLVAHWEREWWNADAGESPGFAARFRPLLEGIDGWRPIVLGREPAMAGLARAGLPGLTASDVSLLLDRADGNPQLLVEVIERIRRSPAWRTPEGPLSDDGRRQLVTASFDLHRLVRERMESDTTPDEVRRAVAVSSVQGVEFSCALVEAAAALLRAGPVREGLEEAEERHRYVTGVDLGVAGFLQRAYREAALGLVGGQFGSEEAVSAALARAADEFLDDGARWERLNEAEREAVLALRATLGETSAEPAIRHRAAGAMVLLARRALTANPEGADVSRAARWARRFAAGLVENRWNPDEFSLDDLTTLGDAAARWDGPGAALPLLLAIAERTRGEAAAGTPLTARQRAVPLLNLANGLRYAGRIDEEEEVGREVLAMARDLVEGDASEHHGLLLSALMLEASRLVSVEDHEGAVAILRERYLVARRMADRHPAEDDDLRTMTEAAVSYARGLNRWGEADLDLPLELLLPVREPLTRLLERERLGVDIQLLATIDLEIGQTLLRRGEPSDAAAYFRNAVEALRLTYGSEPLQEYRLALVNGLSQAAEAAWESRDGGRAMEYLREARAAMEAVDPPPDAWHGATQMKLYALMSRILSSMGAACGSGGEADLELEDVFRAGRALVVRSPMAMGFYAEMTGRLAGTLQARAAIDPGERKWKERAEEMRDDARALLPSLDREWALSDWFQEGLLAIDELLRGCAGNGDPAEAARLAEAGLRWAASFHEAVPGDESLDSVLFWVVETGREVLEAGLGLEPDLVRTCGRIALEPWRGEVHPMMAASRPPALALLATLGGDIPTHERDEFARVARVEFDSHPSWMGHLAGLEMESALGNLPDAAVRCALLDDLAREMIPGAGEPGMEERAEWRFLQRLRRNWECAAGEAIAGGGGADLDGPLA